MPGRPTNEPSNYLAIGVQTAKDDPADTFHFFKHLDGSGFAVEEDVTSEREGGDGQEVGLRYKTLVKADGAVNINARVGGAGRLMAWALGGDSVASVAAGQEHTITPVLASMPYLTEEQFWADVVERTTNVQVTGFTLSGESGQPMKLEAQTISGGTTTFRPAASALTPAREAGKPVFYPGASIVIDGAGNSKVTKYSVEVTRSVDDGIVTTGINREDVVPLNFDLNANFTLKYEDKALYAKVHGATNVPITLATGSFEVFAREAGGSRSMRVVVPLIDYTGAAVNKLDPDGKTMYIDVAGMSIKGATHPIFAEIVDSAGATAPYTADS